MAATADVLDEGVAALRAKLGVQTPEDMVQWINMLIYGDPGAGKTLFASTADDFEETRPVLFFDVEGGLTTIRKKSGIDVKPVRSMKDLETGYNDLFKSIRDGKLYYKTVVVDSHTELTALDMKSIMKEAYDRNPANVHPDVPSQREWGIAREHMRKITRAFRDLPCNVIFTAHAASLQEEGQPTRILPGFAGKLRTDIPGFVDVVGYLYTKVAAPGGEPTRIMQFRQTNRVIAKDRTGSLGEFLENPTFPMLWELAQSSG